MKTFLKISLYCTLMFLAGTTNVLGQSVAAAPSATGQAVILFPFNKSVIDDSFMDNAQGLKVLHDIMSNEAFVSELDSIIVTASSSPDGASWYNRLLAQRRANSIKNFIIENYPYVSPSIINARTNQKYWEGLIEIVEQDSDVPSRDEFLKMLRNPELSDDEKNQIMNTMSEGAVFAYIRDNFILRRLRWGTASVMFYPPMSEPEPQAELQPVIESEPEPEPIPESQPEPMPEPVVKIQAVVPQYKTPVALRTNLLLNVVGGPNLGIEVPIGRKFSVAGDFAYAHTRINNRYALQTIQGTLEGRYWFRHGKNILTGWNLGVYGTYSSRFDIQWGGGYQGDGYWSGGLSGGYSVPVSKCFNLDFSVAGGLVYSPEIRQYSKPRDGHLIWEKTMYNVTRFTLTQVRVNLVWLINKKVK